MYHPNMRRDENRLDHERHEDNNAAERHEREYYGSRHDGPSAANYPQYLAENRRYRASPGSNEFNGPPRRENNAGEYGTGEYRYGDQPRFSPLRFGSFDEVRNDSFGYTEIVRQPHSFGPYVQGGGQANRQPLPGYYDPIYGNVGMNWQGPGYLHHPDQFKPASPDEAAHSRQEHGRHFDPDYHQWRAEQIRKLDSDYEQWRHERYQKFSEDFNTWRATRPSQAPTQIEEPPASPAKPDTKR